DRIMMQVLAAVPIAGLEPALVAVELVLESGSLSADQTLKVKGRPHNTSAFRPDGKDFLRSPITPAERNLINESIAQIRFNSQPTHPESQVDPSKAK
ncbi:MAG: hypothetical protein ACOH2R_28060, partial [Pseudomonas sp.]